MGINWDKVNVPEDMRNLQRYINLKYSVLCNIHITDDYTTDGVLVD